ncbi:MAG: DUF5677 domain-containing protein, partial [Actinobacteria bacterium]|nr:DUF5677 domain-containing protein [Actinomycetota bacterium]
ESMTGKANDKEKTRAKQRPLADHKRQGRVFIPPIMAAAGGRLVERSWHRETLPDFLWIALMLGRRSDWRAVFSALDVVDRFVPDGPRFADGRLTTFALVPEAARSAARESLRSETPHALPGVFGHVIGLYPTCPARWLYADWLGEHEPDPEQGLPLVRQLVGEHTDKGGVNETRLRMAAFSRRVTHGKMSYPGTGVFKLFPKYPNGLNTQEQRQVESVLRGIWMSFFGQEAETYPDVLRWPRDFWARNRELASCDIPFDREEIEMPDADGPIDPEPLLASELTGVLRAMDALGDTLKRVQLEIVKDPEADGSVEVLLGLASRLYRLLYALIERPSAWSPDTLGLHVRPIVDTRIVVGWLIARNDPEMFAAYRQHGLGRLKLLRDHIEADLGDDAGEEHKQFVEYLNRRVNLERDEWFQPVNVGSYADVGPRDMAIEAGLKRVYDLSYAPLSSDNHGEWPAVRDGDTVRCKEPLHGNHRVGAFDPPTRVIRPSPVGSAIECARAGIEQVFGHYEKQGKVADALDAVEAAFEKAAYSSGQ